MKAITRSAELTEARLEVREIGKGWKVRSEDFSWEIVMDISTKFSSMDTA